MIGPISLIIKKIANHDLFFSAGFFEQLKKLSVSDYQRLVIIFRLPHGPCCHRGERSPGLAGRCLRGWPLGCPALAGQPPTVTRRPPGPRLWACARASRACQRRADAGPVAAARAARRRPGCRWLDWLIRTPNRLVLKGLVCL